MRPITFVAGLLAAGLLLPTQASAELVMTAPPELVAGSGSTLLMRFDGLGDLDPSTQPTAQVDGSGIRIDLNDECAEIFCDVMDSHLFRVDLPPLAEGEYEVVVYPAAGSATERGRFTLAVGPEADEPALIPAGGFWKPVDMGGTGLHFQYRGGVLAVSQFDQVGGDADWRLDAVPLQGNSAIVVLRDYAGGSCFGCDPHVAPTPADGGMAMRIDFASARTATAMLVDGTVVPLVNMSYGADYVAVDTGTTEEFGSLALPDLSGTWAIGGPVQRVVTFYPPDVGPPGAHFVSVDTPTVRIRCGLVSDDPTLQCILDDADLPPSTVFGVATLGNVSEDRVLFQDYEGGSFVAIRIPDAGSEAMNAPLPAEGFWTIPGKSGTGMHFQHRGELLAVSQFDFVEEESHWRLGVAPLGADGAEVALHSYSGGSCFGCTPHVAPQADDNPPVATIVFDSARRATVDLGGDTVIPLVNFPFGADYVDVQLPGGGDGQFGPLYLPDLSGTWAFDLGGDAPMSSIVALDGPILVDESVRFVGEVGDWSFTLICEPGSEVAPAGCELQVIGDLVIGTPPPGWYPFARLGDIEEDRMRFVGGPGGTEEGGFRVFYAVRIPAGG